MNKLILMYNFLVNHAFYFAIPTFVIMGIAVFIFIMWMFGTDYYDSIQNTNSYQFMFFFNLINLGFMYLLSPPNPINFICIVINYIFIICIVSEKISQFNKFCKQKRGKK